MYIELVLSDFDGFNVLKSTPDSTPENAAGKIATHARALETFKDIIKCLTCVNFDGSSSTLGLSANVRDSSVFVHDDPKTPTITSFLSHTTFGPTVVDGVYDYDGWVSCQNTTTRICDTILRFDTQDTVYYIDGTVDATNSIPAYLYVKMSYVIDGVYDLPINITLSLLNDGTTKPTTLAPDLTGSIPFHEPRLAAGSVSFDTTSYKLIISLSLNHVYMTGITKSRNINGNDTVYMHPALLLTKYKPMDVWYNTPVEEKKDLIAGWKRWAFMRVYTKTPTSGPTFGGALNMFSNKTKTLVTDVSSCKIKWLSTMNIMHSSTSDQGKLPIFLISDESKQQAMYMQHLNITSASGINFTGDITSENNIYWMHGMSGQLEDIITDVFGRSYKLLLLNYGNSSKMTLTPISGSPADTKKITYPKLAIPMF